MICLSQTTLLSRELQLEVEKAAMIVRDFAVPDNPKNWQKRGNTLRSNLALRLKRSGIDSKVIAVITRSRSVLAKLVGMDSLQPISGQGVVKQKTLVPIGGCDTQFEWKKFFVQKLLKSEL